MVFGKTAQKLWALGKGQMKRKYATRKSAHRARASERRRSAPVRQRDVRAQRRAAGNRAALKRKASRAATAAFSTMNPHLAHPPLVRVLNSMGKRVSGVDAEDRRLLDNAREAYAGVGERKGDGYRADLSTDEVGVYVPAGGDPVLAYRGTANAGDAVTDLSLSAGRLRHTERWRRSEAHTKDVLEKLKGELGHGRFDVTGHSLGGTLAQHSADRFGAQRSVVFNPGASVLDSTLRRDSKSRIYSMQNDAVSGMATLTPSDVRIIPNNKDMLSAHFGSAFG